MENGDPAKLGCVVCNAQVKIGEMFIREKMETKNFYDGKSISFQNLIHSLIPNPAEDYKEKMIEGCQIFFPDTVFFEKGKIIICAMDKDYCLSIKDSRNQKTMQVRLDLDKAIEIRKGKTEQFWL